MSPEPRAYHVRGRVLPGGEIRDVYVAGGRITFDPQPGAESLCDDGFVVPGLVDAHAHLAISSPVDADLPDAMAASAGAHLAAGVLLIRDPGGPGHDDVQIGPEDGLPRVINAGHFLAPYGRYFPGIAREIDPDELPDAAAEEARQSGAWAKVIGDFLGPDGRIGPHFEISQLRGAVERVHAIGARITIHAMAAATVEQAIDAGFDAIEHGTEATPAMAEEMGRRGIAWVPTLIIGDGIRDTVRQMAAPDEVPRWDAAVAGQPAVVRHAAEAGVRLLAGTDAGMVPHGLIARELSLLVRSGLEAERALAAASWESRAYLGLPGIEEGAPGDLVVFERDPRADVETLPRPSIRVLDGRLVGG